MELRMRENNFAFSKGYKIVTINELVVRFIDRVTGGKRWINGDDQVPNGADHIDHIKERAWFTVVLL